MGYDENKRCGLCGTDIYGGGRELLDGWVCSDCAGKLSPWYRDFDCGEVEELRQQLALRKENLKKLKQFRPTRKFGERVKVLVDDSARTFVVTDRENFRQANPDLLSIEDVIDCSIHVEEDRAEIGPKTYRYTYQFTVEISLDHDYLDEITFPLNEEPLCYESSEKSFLGFGGFDPEGEEDYDYYEALGQKIEDVLCDMEEEGEDESPYAYEEEEFPEEEQGLPGDVVTCPWCGSKTRVTDSFRCEHCGGTL